MINIKLIRTNFQVRFGYIPDLTDYIKKIPKDQVQTKMEAITENGKNKEDWFRICNIAGLSKILWYCWDNNLKIIYQNFKNSDIERIKDFANNKRKSYLEALRLKTEGFNIENEDYSFMKIQPYAYQKEAVQFFEGTNGIALLGDSPGIGKTLSAISYAVKHKLKTLVVCPASLKLNWRKEILKFSNELAYVFKYYPKKKENVINYSPEDSLFHIVNYDSLDTYLKFSVHHKCDNSFCDFEETSLVKKYKLCPKCFKEKSVKSRNTELCKFEDKKGESLNLNDYDLVVLDESHMIKETKTHRTKVIKTGFKNIKKKILLTGTAIKNRPYEFFSQLNFLDEFEWVNAHSFGVRYCDGHEDKFGHWNYDGASNLDELYERISYCFLRRLKKDVLKHLPPKTYTIIPIELTIEEQREYNKLEKGVVDEIEQDDTKISYLAKVQKLKQFTSKLNAERAIEFIQNIIDGDQKIIVFTQFLATADYIYQKFKNCAVIFTGKHNITEKNEAVERFMEDENCKVFVGSTGAAGVGITLTSANIVLFIDNPWDPSTRLQCEDRAHRATQIADNVQIIRMICQNTIDVDIEELLNEKEKILNQVLDGGLDQVNPVEFSIFSAVVDIILSKKAA